MNVEPIDTTLYLRWKLTGAEPVYSSRGMFTPVNLEARGYSEGEYGEYQIIVSGPLLEKPELFGIRSSVIRGDEVWPAWVTDGMTYLLNTVAEALEAAMQRARDTQLFLQVAQKTKEGGS